MDDSLDRVALLACGARRGGRGKVTTIDDFMGSPRTRKGGELEVPEIAAEGTSYRVFADNMEQLGVAADVIAMKMTSAEPAAGWPSAIRLLFIDGDHSYGAVKQDRACPECHHVQTVCELGIARTLDGPA